MLKNSTGTLTGTFSSYLAGAVEDLVEDVDEGRTELMTQMDLCCFFSFLIIFRLFYSYFGT